MNDSRKTVMVNRVNDWGTENKYGYVKKERSYAMNSLALAKRMTVKIFS